MDDAIHASEPEYGDLEFLYPWIPLNGSFLEPNRFSISYDDTPSRLLLQAGYGQPVTHIGPTRIGAEILVWSGLKTLSGFRFPVETADYFFGFYSESPVLMFRKLFSLRTRLSHISSHYVDGSTDTIIGGSSSRFSREFASVELQNMNMINKMFTMSIGLKYVFHQVNKFEPAIQVPVAIDYHLLTLGKNDNITLYASTAAGPSLPVFAGGLTYRHPTGREQALELFAEYHDGHSRYGVDGDTKQRGFEIGMRLIAE